MAKQVSVQRSTGDASWSSLPTPGDILLMRQARQNILAAKCGMTVGDLILMTQQAKESFRPRLVAAAQQGIAADLIMTPHKIEVAIDRALQAS